MNNFYVFQPVSGGVSASRFEAAKALPKFLAKSDPELPDPEMIVWLDRSTTMASFVFEGVSAPMAGTTMSFA